MRWRKLVRIVLDTNILVSALISQAGPPGQVLAEVKRGRLKLITSVAQIAELRRVLGRPHLRRVIAPDVAQDLMANIEAVGEVVGDLPDVTASPDPDDNLILATAIAGRADRIVSGDKTDMLALGRVEGIPIITASAAAAAEMRGRYS